MMSECLLGRTPKNKKIVYLKRYSTTLNDIEEWGE